MRCLLNDTKRCTASKATWEAKFQRQVCFLWRNSMKMASWHQVTASLQPNKVCNTNKTLWLSFCDNFCTSTLFEPLCDILRWTTSPPAPPFRMCAHTRRMHAHIMTFNPIGLIHEGLARGSAVYYPFICSILFLQYDEKSNPHCLSAGVPAKG